MNQEESQFWLQIATMLFTFLTGTVASYIAYRQRQADKDREAKQDENRQNTAEVARAIGAASTTQVGADVAREAQRNILEVPPK